MFFPQRGDFIVQALATSSIRNYVLVAYNFTKYHLFLESQMNPC